MSLLHEPGRRLHQMLSGGPCERPLRATPPLLTAIELRDTALERGLAIVDRLFGRGHPPIGPAVEFPHDLFEVAPLRRQLVFDSHGDLRIDPPLNHTLGFEFSHALRQHPIVQAGN